MKKFLPLQLLLTCVLIAGIYGFSRSSLNRTENETRSTHISSISLNKKAGVPDVYLTQDISAQGLVDIYNALGRQATGNVAIKLHTGEPGGNNFLAPDLIRELVQSVNGTIVECNTAYGGSRATTAMHRQVAIDHGFTEIAEVDIMDADGYISLPVTGGTHLEENFVGSHFQDYNFYIILSHFKGHQMGGFGGAIKNMSIGIASSRGKSWIHSAGTETTGIWGDHNNFLESMAEAASSVADELGDSIIYINVMNNLSVDCDCNSHPAEPTMADIGILASLDPVALDQACVDLVYEAPDGQDLINRMESLDGMHTLEHAVQIGFGNRSYNLVNIDSTSSAINKETKLVNVYPNPAQDKIYIPNHTAYDRVTIIDIEGRVISRLSSRSEINIQMLKEGQYLVRLIKENEVIGVCQIIKK